MTAPAFHAGEQAMQARAGVRERLAEVGPALLRDHMPEQHRSFFGLLPTLLLAAQDADGQPWATMLQGRPGFVTSPDARTLQIHARPGSDDPLHPWLQPGAAVGLLGLQPHTRRRNRANGVLQPAADGVLQVLVRQSFGNCPQYIHARRPEPLSSQQPAPARWLGPALDAPSVDLLQRADTLFIASASGPHTGPGAAATEGVDVSHRGGPRGFLRVEHGAAGLRLTLPDYRGNFFFNTLGNLQLWPLAGLLLPDYEDGSLLHIAARATLIHDGPSLAGFPGAQRLLQLHVLRGLMRPQALPLRWTPPEAPPQFVSAARAP